MQFIEKNDCIRQRIFFYLDPAGEPNKYEGYGHCPLKGFSFHSLDVNFCMVQITQGWTTGAG
jgi:hypothetical protein